MKKNILTLVIGTFVFLSSCSSSDDDKNNPTPSPTVQDGCKLTKVTSPRANGGTPYMEAIFTYNGDKIAGFLLSYLYDDVPSRYELVYDKSDRITEILYFEKALDQTTSLKYKLEYNNNGQVSKVQGVIGTLPVFEDIYTYEGNKRTQKQIYSLNELWYTYNYEWQDDNCVKMSQIDHEYGYNWSKSIQYLTTTNTMPKLGLELLDIIELDYVPWFYEYASKNLVASYTYTFTQKGLVENVYLDGTLEYQFEYSCE